MRLGGLTLRALLVLVPLLAAGCLAPGVDPAAVPDDPAIVLPYLDVSESHVHADPRLHDAGWNLDVVGWSPLQGSLTAFGRDFNQARVAGTTAFVSAYRVPDLDAPGFLVADIADAAAPTVVATVSSGHLLPVDVALNEDGTLLALAGHRFVADGAPTVPAPQCTAAPTTPPMNVCQPFAPYGVQLFDVSAPATPTLLASYYSVPTGAHTVKLKTVDGTLYAFLASYGVTSVDRLASSVEILRYDPSGPGGAALVPVARFFPEERSSQSRGVFVHDTWIEEHPVTGDLLMYVAYWDGGVVIANVNDPESPRQIVAWKDFDGATFGNVHFALPMRGLLHGKHVTVAAPEFGAAEHAGEMYVLDTTDPTQPALLATWRLPASPVNSGNYLHSPHNFDVTDDGRVVYAHYHAGVWVLDLDPLVSGAADAPAVLGYRFPVPPADVTAPLPEDEFAPNVWSALWTSRGDVVASDIVTGLYVLRLASPDAGTPPYTGLV